MEGLGINIGYLAVQIIAFIVIYTLLTRFLYDPLGNVLRERRQRIAKGLEDAAEAANARLNAEKDAEKIRQAAQAEAQKIIEEARGRAEEVAKTIEAQARSEADKVRADARTRAEEERNAELSGLRGQVAAISIAVAQRLIGENLDEKRQQTLINDFFSKVPKDAKALSGNVEVVSAMPLDDKEQAKVKKETGANNVTFTVDPGILGGLIIRAGDKVVDGSVRSGLNELSERLK
jgi:F-type H+-transporting ATPase subunit b